MAEITLDTITKDEIIQMAKYIQELEQINKDQKGYILQLQKQLSNAGKRLAQMSKQQQSVGLNTTPIVVEAATLDLPTLNKG